MHDSANQMDTSPSPACSMLPDPDEGFGGAGIGSRPLPFAVGRVPVRGLVATEYQGFTDAFNHSPAPYFSGGTHFPTPALGNIATESSVATSSTGLYQARGNSLDAPWSQFQDNSFRIQDQHVVSPYARQPLGLGHHVNDSQLQGCNNDGYAQNQEGYSASVFDFTTGYQNQPDFIENQALTAGLNHQAQFLGGQTNPFGINVYENPCVESPALYRPTSTNAVYPSQTYSDATFPDFNAAHPSLCGPPASSLNLSGSAFSGHTMQLPMYPEGSLLANPTFPGQASFSDEYLPNAYQSMQYPTPDLHGSLVLPNSTLPTVSASPMQDALPSTDQYPSIQCTQPTCTATFKREADRIRHHAAVHGTNHGLHLCSIPGCVKAQGRGYSRADKVTEHLWKKHGDLGYVKRVN
ncbi:hypothetical protein L207DRAFT_528299 [Hyaloscypha variabilis F]|uniref:C2H2-type domain-containing protein n=1 Tax=Hyaloscypha variabilis (strain UAMH 11265 / GT02V1 / F) TaxID=1149755 RepID=A0A2J6RT58_HYAVF|nr:hypothetical protein L207DRAFT_528299 [Hyaloscypha variabilis F]